MFEEYVSSTRVPSNLTKIRFLCSSDLYPSSIRICFELWTGSLLQGKALDFLMSFSLVSLSLWTNMSFHCSIELCRSDVLVGCVSLFIVGFQIYPLKEDKFEFRTFSCSCHTCSCLVIVVECFLQPQSQIFRDFLNFVHLTSDWTKSNGTQFETEIPCTNLGIYVLVSTALLFEVLKLMSFSFA